MTMEQITVKLVPWHESPPKNKVPCESEEY
jgi:hypothetical protein